VEKIWDLGNLIPKLYPNPKIKSQDAISRRKRPDGRTRRGHAPKRVAFGYKSAAFPRQISHFRGISDESGDQLSWESCNWTLTPSAPINTPCSATYRASSVQQRAKVRIFRVSLLSSSFVIRVSFYFQEREMAMLRVTLMYASLLHCFK